MSCRNVSFEVCKMLGNTPGEGRVLNIVVFYKAMVKRGKGTPVFNSAPCYNMGNMHLIIKVEAMHPK
jgi:hypothetical protein